MNTVNIYSLVVLGTFVAMAEALVILASVWLGFYLTKTAYTYNNPALGNVTGPDNSMSVTQYDQDMTDELYAQLGNLGDFKEEEADPVHETVRQMMAAQGLRPEDTLGPSDIPNEPFVGQSVEDIADDNR